MIVQDPRAGVWATDSWRAFPALQQPDYPDRAALQAVLDELRQLPPLVTSWEVVMLREKLAAAVRGEAFVLQAGDCAERFADCTPRRISNKLKVLVQMSLVLVLGAKMPVIRVGRFAGQYAKPRSDDFETRDGVRLPSYRGDIVNRPEFTTEARTPDPSLLLRGYERSSLTLNFARALAKGGFADLHHPEYFDLDWSAQSAHAGDYRRLVDTITESLRFMENVLGVKAGETDRIDFFTSHEALHLGYESAQTRQVPHRPGYFDLTAHMPWLGVRTADPEGAHVEFLRGIENPIGVKVGPATTADQLLRLLDRLHPHNVPGRLTLIHRFGAATIAAALPPLIQAVREDGRNVLWVCDPMHGNTRTTANGYKTRSFEEIRGELDQAFDLHAAHGSRLGGVHIEMTGENVTECTGGARGLAESDLPRAYETMVDPRLNYEQSLEIAFLIASKMAKLHQKHA
ncbi:MAG: 3-deoxy-7-phosphoheptulonate synthase class II [Bryobacteraceae bacterium]|nr:3-deoxy-7-phosphoheptulonate synthase class II [Bryobacteraceae bacterium]